MPTKLVTKIIHLESILQSPAKEWKCSRCIPLTRLCLLRGYNAPPTSILAGVFERVRRELPNYIPHRVLSFECLLCRPSCFYIYCTYCLNTEMFPIIIYYLLNSLSISNSFSSCPSTVSVKYVPCYLISLQILFLLLRSVRKFHIYTIYFWMT